jgi:hypothetical protein
MDDLESCLSFAAELQSSGFGGSSAGVDEDDGSDSVVGEIGDDGASDEPLLLSGFMNIARNYDKLFVPAFGLPKRHVLADRHQYIDQWPKKPREICYNYEPFPTSVFTRETVLPFTELGERRVVKAISFPSSSSSSSSSNSRNTFHHEPFCYCNTISPELRTSGIDADSEARTVRCAVGIAGCNGKLHLRCIGLAHLTDLEVRNLDCVVCPLCTLYIDGIDDEHYRYKIVR